MAKKDEKKDKKAAKKAEKKAEKKKAEKAEKKAARKAAKLAKKQAKEPPTALARQPIVEPAKARAPRKAKAAAGKAARRVVPRKAAPPKRRQPASLRLRSASPSLTVNDIDASLAFYRDILLFTVRERWEEDGVLRGVELLAGTVTFWISQDDWKKGRDRIKGQGFRIYCTTVQDIDAMAEGIKARGGTLAEEPQDRPWGGRDFAVVDPDGFTITIASEA